MAGPRAEILRSSSGWDHRVDLGSGPAQTHSTRPAHTATTPQPIPVGHGGAGGGSPGPTTKAARTPPPTVIPGRRHISSSACGSQIPRTPSSPCSPRDPGPATTRGRPAARDTMEGGGGWETLGSVLFQKSSHSHGRLGKVPHPPARPWEAPSLQTPHTQKPWQREGGAEARPDKGPLSPAPGVSSFLQVLLSGPPHSLRGGSAPVRHWEAGTRGLERERQHPHPCVWHGPITDA